MTSKRTKRGMACKSADGKRWSARVSSWCDGKNESKKETQEIIIQARGRPLEFG